MADQVEGALTTLSDLAYELRRYSEQIEFNPARLDQIELRIDLINNLKRKHGGSVAEVLNFYHKAQDELEQIENVETQIQEIKKKIDSLKLTLVERALRIQKKETGSHAGSGCPNAGSAKTPRNEERTVKGHAYSKA